MPYALEPLVAGELGEGTVMDSSTHPPTVSDVEYVLDAPTSADLIESFPVFLVSSELAERLANDDLDGFTLEDARVVASREYEAAFDAAEHKSYRRLCPARDRRADCWLDDQYRLCVSDRMYAVLEQADLTGCDIEPVA